MMDSLPHDDGDACGGERRPLAGKWRLSLAGQKQKIVKMQHMFGLWVEEQTRV